MLHISIMVVVEYESAQNGTKTAEKTVSAPFWNLSVQDQVQATALTESIMTSAINHIREMELLARFDGQQPKSSELTSDHTTGDKQDNE